MVTMCWHAVSVAGLLSSSVHSKAELHVCDLLLCVVHKPFSYSQPVLLKEPLSIHHSTSGMQSIQLPIEERLWVEVMVSAGRNKLVLTGNF